MLSAVDSAHLTVTTQIQLVLKSEVKMVLLMEGAALLGME